MRPIPKKLRDEMASDPFYKRCCVTGLTHGKIDWHHNFTFKGRQLNEKWCILPLNASVHDDARRKDMRLILDWIMLNRASDDTLRQYSKAVDLIRLRGTCNEILGKWSEGAYPTFAQKLAAREFTEK